MQCAYLFTHVPFDSPAPVRHWLETRGFHIDEKYSAEVANWASLALPDCVISLGGPMSAWQEATYPWLKAEKAFIQRCIAAGVPTVGICLGGQLIADVLGGDVRTNSETEIGWFPLTPTHDCHGHPMEAVFVDQPLVLHWHSDCFSAPDDALLLASSAGCTQQAFMYQQHVLAIQFHLELGEAQVRRLIKSDVEDLQKGGRFVQQSNELLADLSRFQHNEARLEQLLDAFWDTATKNIPLPRSLEKG